VHGSHSGRGGRPQTAADTDIRRELSHFARIRAHQGLSWGRHQAAGAAGSRHRNAHSVLTTCRLRTLSGPNR